jgi:hypothetical protein
MPDDRRGARRNVAQIVDVAIHSELHLPAAPLERFPHLEVGREVDCERAERSGGARTPVHDHHRAGIPRVGANLNWLDGSSLVARRASGSGWVGS